MFNNFFRKVGQSKVIYKTYRWGLLEAKSHRILQAYTTDILKPFKLSPIEWEILGLLSDHKSGVKLAAIAKELGVEAPFVTVNVNTLQKKGLMEYKSNPKDKRAKLASLTTQGDKEVEEIEKILKKKMDELYKDIPMGDLLTHLSVLEAVIENT